MGLCQLNCMYIIFASVSEIVTTDLQEGVSYSFLACLLDPTDVCKVSYNISVRRCGYEMQYYLVATDGDSAYCFGI